MDLFDFKFQIKKIHNMRSMFYHFRIILFPLGQWMGLRKSNKTFASLAHNEELENVYRKNRSKLTYKEMEAIAKRTDMEVRQIERWMRKRLAKDKHTTLAKFSECGYVHSQVYTYYIYFLSNWNSTHTLVTGDKLF